MFKRRPTIPSSDGDGGLLNYGKFYANIRRTFKNQSLTNYL